MDLDFIPEKNALYIPKDVYRPIKSCPFCQSIYLSDLECESCGRKLNFDYLGLPFSAKSYFGIRERYLKSFSHLMRLFPLFENRNSPQTLSYTRNLYKRYKDLLLGLTTSTLMKSDDRKFFILEIKFLITEMLEYGIEEKQLIDQMMSENDKDFIFNHLVNYIREENIKKTPYRNAIQVFLDFKLLGIFKVERFLFFVFCMATLIFVAMKFRFVFIKN